MSIASSISSTPTKQMKVNQRPVQAGAPTQIRKWEGKYGERSEKLTMLE
jgi:hypothetical protein